MLDIVYHCNTAQPHQVEHGQWLEAGLKRHGIKLRIATASHAPGDIHIVSGPHYAKRLWQGHARVLLLDRALYHDGRSGRWHSMDWVSLGWMNHLGGRKYRVGEGRIPPVVKPKRTAGGTIFLADWNGQVEDADTVRLHPDNEKYNEPLIDCLRRHRKAIGYMTTALVTAALEGLEIECRDVRSILAQPDWLDALPYADWHSDEIGNGDFWEHFKHDLDASNSPAN